MTGKKESGMGKNRFNKTPLEEEIFIEGMEKLQTNFNLKEFTAKRAELYYQKLKHIGDNEFTETVENIINRERYFPTIACFRDYLGKNGGQKDKDHEKYRQTELAKSRVGAHYPAIEPQEEITLEEYTTKITEMIREMTGDPEAIWEPSEDMKKYFENRNDSKKQ